MKFSQAIIQNKIQSEDFWTEIQSDNFQTEIQYITFSKWNSVGNYQNKIQSENFLLKFNQTILQTEIQSRDFFLNWNSVRQFSNLEIQYINFSKWIQSGKYTKWKFSQEIFWTKIQSDNLQTEIQSRDFWNWNQSDNFQTEIQYINLL